MRNDVPNAVIDTAEIILICLAVLLYMKIFG